MLQISSNELKMEAKKNGYRPEIVEKVYHLLNLLEEIMAIPYLSNRLALKGGTAINLFFSKQFPRLSVDIDLNYIGSVDKEIMKQEKIEIENILMEVCKRKKYELYRNPQHYAGGKTVLIYKSLLGTKGHLEIDLNYLYRSPLWKPDWQYSLEWPKKIGVNILDVHELAAGKLNALLDRVTSRDLFDSHKLLTKWKLDNEKLRLSFTVYNAMRRQNWQDIKVDNIKFSVKDIRDKLIPVLKNFQISSAKTIDVKTWAKKLTTECKEKLNIVLPFRENKIAFFEALQKYKEIKPELISSDMNFCQRVKMHPLLLWRIKTV